MHVSDVSGGYVAARVNAISGICKEVSSKGGGVGGKW
jgi:hypothetical protein